MRKIVIAILLLLVGCSLSEIVDLRQPEEEQTEPYYPRMRKDTTEKADSGRVPISFDVSVDNWGDEQINEIE